MKEQNVKDDHYEFFRAIERIKVAGLIGLSNKNDQVFYHALNEINEILSKSFVLFIEKNKEFQKIFNPNYIEYKDDILIDFDRGNNQIDINRNIPLFSEKSFISKKSVQYGFNTLIEVHEVWRNKCVEIERVDLAKYINEGLIELLQKVTSISSDFKTNAHQHLIQHIIYSIIHQKYSNNLNDLDLAPLQIQGSYDWYLSILFNPDCNIELYFNSLDDLFFESLKTTLKFKSEYIIQLFARRLIDGIITPELHYLFKLFDQFELTREKRRNFYSRLDSILSKSRKTFLFDEYLDTYNDFSLLCSSISDESTDIDYRKLEAFKIRFIKGLKSSYLINHLRINLIHVLSYFLFKENLKAISVLLNYHSPVGNHSTYSSSDIIPKNINDLKEIGLRKNRIDLKFYYLWDGHQDNVPYFNSINLILLARSYYYKQEEFRLDAISYENENELRSFLRYLESINNNKNHDYLNLNVFPGFTEEFKINFGDALTNLINEINHKIKINFLNKPINPKVVDEFKSDVIKALHINPSVWNIYKSFDKFSYLKPKSSEDLTKIGYFSLDHKGYFIDDNEGVYVNWPGTYARIISENLESYLTRGLASVSERIKCPKYKFINELEKIDLKNKIIISNNFRISSDMLYNDPEFKKVQLDGIEKLDLNGKIGSYKGAEVYEMFYLNAKWESVMILDKSDLGELQIEKLTVAEQNDDSNFDNVYFAIKGFSNDKDVDSFLEQNVNAFRNLPESEKKIKLKESVLIEFYMKLHFVPPKNQPLLYNF